MSENGNSENSDDFSEVIDGDELGKRFYHQLCGKVPEQTKKKLKKTYVLIVGIKCSNDAKPQSMFYSVVLFYIYNHNESTCLII